MGDEEVDVVDLRAGARERLVRGGDHAPDGVAVDARGPPCAAWGRRARRRGGRRGAASEPRMTGPIPSSRSPPATTTAPAPSPKSDRRGAVVVVGDPRERLGAAHQHDAGAAALDERGGLVERVEEAGARGVDVDRRRALGADEQRDVRRQPGRQAVGRDRRDDDGVELRGRAPGVGERALARPCGEPGELLVRPQDAALADAGAPDDPRVVGVQARPEVAVGDDPLGQRGADAEDPGAQGRARGGAALRAPAASGGWPKPSSIVVMRPAASA